METIPVSHLKGRLQQYSAVYQPDKSNAQAHVYYSAPSRRYIKVVRKGAHHVELTFHTTCPVCHL